VQSEFFFFIEIIRAKLHRIYETLDRLKREVVTAQMRMQKVETDCPSDWSPIKGELDDLFGTIGSSVDRALRDLFLGEGRYAGIGRRDSSLSSEGKFFL
jgi:hypothetical protein